VRMAGVRRRCSRLRAERAAPAVTFPTLRLALAVGGFAALLFFVV
jgi:hypothetical protein